MPGRACSSNNFDLTAGGSDFFLRRFAECVSLHGERNFQLTIAKNFHDVALGAQDADAEKKFGRNGRALLEVVKFFHVHDGVFGAVRRNESALRKTAMQ